MVERLHSGVSLPHGTVTFLFLDIEGSTRLLQELGEEYADVLAGHRRLLREEFARHGGVEVDTQGDAFFVAFAKASDALAAAVTVREALADGPIRVRVGLPAEALQLRQCLAEEIEISFVDKITPGVRAVNPNRHRRAVGKCAETCFALPQQPLA